MTHLRALLLTLAVVVTTAGCASVAPERPGLDPASAEVRYEFHDSSVPPEYHRSYTLTVTASGARLVVDSYGDVVHDVTVEVPEPAWSQVRERVAGLASGSSGEDCPGGTSEDLTAISDGTTVVSVHTGSCGGPDGHPLADAVRPALALFDLDTLLATG